MKNARQNLLFAWNGRAKPYVLSNSASCLNVRSLFCKSGQSTRSISDILMKPLIETDQLFPRRQLIQWKRSDGLRV